MVPEGWILSCTGRYKQQNIWDGRLVSFLAQSVKAETHQAGIGRTKSEMSGCCVALHRICLAQKAAVEHSEFSPQLAGT